MLFWIGAWQWRTLPHFPYFSFSLIFKFQVENPNLQIAGTTYGATTNYIEKIEYKFSVFTV